MKRFYKILLCALSIIYFFHPLLFAQQTPFELHGKNYSATYDECIQYYKQLDRAHTCVSMETMGMTDAGLPLHIVMISRHGKNNPEHWKKKKMVVILINNGIHPGEPDGIDASMMLVRDAARQIEETDSFPSNVALAIIPVYNIGGCLNRSEYYRVDQNGPESFGSRGNSQNLDLNRDFIKCDSKEARSFAELFHWIQPDIFIDNHVSDGADYQHVMTLATTQHHKLGGAMGQYLHSVLEPELYRDMKSKNYPMIPYVNVWGKDARTGWSEFFDGPRYSSGYASLFNVFAFTAETHMLKPYPLRVDATYQLMKSMIAFSAIHADTLKTLRQLQYNNQMQQRIFPLAWRHDDTIYTEIEFNGYPYKTRNSMVSNLPVNYYDRKEPYTEKIKFYNTYKPSISVEAPAAYVIPQGWWRVIDLLQLNGVTMEQFDKNQSLDVDAYKIISYKSGDTPYEQHHPNGKIDLETQHIKIDIRKGDYYIPLEQSAKRFIIEVLEPQASDSYFYWNFFDAILVQKEGYSDYAYEENAAEYLAAHPDVQILLNAKRQTDTAFAANASAQLEFVYRHSPYIEPRHNLYPVYRINHTPQLGILPEKMIQQNQTRIKEDE
jgi:hypothetical protein